MYFALLRDRNGDFSRCRIENIFVTKKKRKKERKLSKKRSSFSSIIKMEKAAILQIKFVFLLTKYSNEIWKVIGEVVSIEYL